LLVLWLLLDGVPQAGDRLQLSSIILVIFSPGEINTYEATRKTKRVQADLLYVGGGITDLIASIRTSELGVKLAVAEITNTMRSGFAVMINDHFVCYIPEAHGPDIEPTYPK